MADSGPRHCKGEAVLNHRRRAADHDS